MSASNGNQDNLAAAMADVSERVTVLVKDEIELAKAEMMQKVASLRLGILGFAIAAVFGLLLVPFLLLLVAWAINDAFSGLWQGFAIVSAILLAGVIGGVLLGIRKIKVGAPTPTMALEEAKKIRETVSTKPGP